MTSTALPAQGRSGHDGGMHATSLLETMTALALTALLAMLAMQGAARLGSAAALEAARLTVIDALLEARRAAYERDATASVAVAAGGGAVRVQPGNHARSLPGGVTIASGPADADVEFRAGGLADNATITLNAGTATAVVVVNQRGVVR